MHRSVLTGIFVFALSASALGVACADETASPGTEIVSRALGTSAIPTAASTVVVSKPATEAAESEDAASPTAGADVAMWSSAAVGSSVGQSEPLKHVNRLRRFASGIVSRSSAIASSLTRSAMRFIGTPYVFGGTRSSGFDCSGYVQHVFAMLGVHLPRTADAQYDAGRNIAAPRQPGDLVFFHTYAPGVSHVGIYLGNSKFIHSSSSRGVAVSSLHDSYWAPRYVGAKRVFGS